MKLFLGLLLLASLAMTDQSQAREIRLVALGDSLTAGYGLGPGQGYPERLAAKLKERGLSVTIQNAGVSGDTTTGGLERLDWSVPDGTDGVLLALGANDVLRGIAPAITRKNLETILESLAKRKIAVLMAGMRAPPNMGAAFIAEYEAIFPELAQKYGVVFIPFQLEGIAAEPGLLLADGMHPNAKGADKMADLFLPKAEELLKQIGPR